MSFYVTLPSSISDKGTTSDYTTYLADTIKLYRKYKVALVEMIYNHSWKIDLGFIYLDYGDNKIHTIPVYLDNNYSTNALITKIKTLIKDNIIEYEYNIRFNFRENELKEHSTEIIFKYDKTKLYPSKSFYTKEKEESVINEIKQIDFYASAPCLELKKNHIDLDSNKDNLYLIQNSNNLIKSVGFQGRITNELNISNNEYFFLNYSSSNRVSLLANDILADKEIKISSALYIYAPDLIEWQYVGNSKAPLLRNPVVEPNPNDKLIWVNFDNPHYVNLITNNVSQIKIYIRDEYDQKVLFNYSDITLKLHFTPV